MAGSPQFGSIGTGISGTDTTCNIPVPSGVSSGDAVMALVFVEDTTTTVGTPDGTWTEVPESPFSNAIGQAYTAHVYIKRASGADSGTYAFTLSQSAFRKAVAFRYTGCVETGALIDVADSANNLEFSGPPAPSPAVEVETTVDNTTLVYISTCWSGATPTDPSGFTSRGNASTGGSWSVSDKAQATAGDSGSVAGSYSTSTVALGSYLAALKPSSGAPAGEDFTADDTDGVGETDSSSTVQGFARSQTDQVGGLDSIAASQDYARAATESLSAADGVTAAQDFARGVADEVSMSDSLGVNQDLVQALTDPMGLTDALTVALEVAQDYLINTLTSIGIIDAATVSLSTPPVFGAIELAPFPANYQVLWETWQSGGVDELHNAVDTWADPVPRMVIGYSSRRLVTQDGIHAAQDMDNLRLAVPADFPWAARDIVTIPTQNALGGRYQVTGAADANMGFHGWRPGLVLEVQRVEG